MFACCLSLLVVFFIAFIYYLFILKEKGELKYKQFQDIFKDLNGNKPKSKVKTSKPEKKPEAEDAEFREVNN